MAMVTLKRLYLHRADDPSVYVTFDGGTELARTDKPGETRRMANGRVRAVTRAGSARALEVTAPFLDLDVFDTIEEWVEGGVLLMLRDAKRRVRWGHIFAIEAPVSGSLQESVSFTFQSITHVEEV